ncbi:MAG: hypothetical protein HQM09_16400, partial [Candidatus Riflebacteria bacterium]|nr:hypothetical protein [Candidatus Riflebacteria bacterium]
MKSDKTSRRRGIGLAEAMVMIVVAGSLAVPILGTLIQSVQNSSNLKHQVSAGELALSAQALIYGSMPLTIDPINRYSEVPTSDGATLTVTVTFSQVPEFATLGPSQGLLEAQKPTNLWAYRIDVDRMGSPDIEAASLTSLTGLICAYPDAQESIFVSSPNPAQPEIAMIDQNTNFVTYFPVESTPGHLVVHPNNKFLYAQCATEVLAICIDPANSYYLKGIASVSYSPGPMFDPNAAENDVGIDIRPDGKFLFCWDKQSKTIKIIKVSTSAPNYLTDTTKFISPQPSPPSFANNTGSVLRISGDNYLYF